jgi:hypothetical protein
MPRCCANRATRLDSSSGCLVSRSSNSAICCFSSAARASSSAVTALVFNQAANTPAPCNPSTRLPAESLEESRYYPILAQDPGYGQTDELMSSLEEVSRLLYAYAAAILTSDF